jgi:hypothetical protein
MKVRTPHKLRRLLGGHESGGPGRVCEFPQGELWDGRAHIFSLDNEPNYWPGTHRELRPNTCGNGVTTYHDIVTRNKAAALAVKGAWPSARVFGPVIAQDGLIYAHSYQNDSHCDRGRPLDAFLDVRVGSWVGCADS